MKNIAVLGSGTVGDALAAGFLKYGYAVMRGSRDPSKLAAWREKAGPHASVGTFAEAARFGALAVLAVKGTAALEAVGLCEGGLDGKTVLDATNPIANAPPVQGVIQYFTGPNESLLEALQAKYGAVRFVKAFSCVGSAHMVDPTFDAKPTMFIAGDHAEAKAEARAVIEQFGWEVEDMGGAPAARAIEPLAMLWCIPGIAQGRWSHAFKLLKK